MSRRRNRNHNNPIRTPADIDRQIADMDRMNVCMELKKLLVYAFERRVYRLDSSSKDYLYFCLANYFALNESSYESFGNVLDLMPLEILSQKTAKCLSFMPGVHKEVLELLEIKCEAHPHQTRVISMVIDEFPITPWVVTFAGRLYGVEDDGVNQTDIPAKFVTQIWITSLAGIWVTPLAYYFTSQPATASQLKSYIFECITKLKSIDLDVVVVNTKLRINFLELSELLGVGPDKQTFKVENSEVVFMFDASHMMCVTRNNLMKHSLKMEDGGETSWKHIKTFFVKESGSDKKNTKLTESHIKPNKYERTLPALAIDVLSNTVAIEMKAYVESGKLSKEVLATAECISIFDRLLHMLNSVHESSVNEYASGYKATKQQTEFLEKVIRFLQTLKVYDNKGEDKTGEVKFVNAWLTTVRGLMKLWEYVKEREYEFLLTGNISSVPLDKFVNTCRLIMFGYNNPSPLELLSSFRDVSVASYFTFETPLPMEDMDIETLALLVYKRIPAVRHNLGNQSQQSLVSIDREECITMMLERLCLDMRF